MPLKWKTTELKTPEGTVKVTHWEKHDPRELLEALKTGKQTNAKHPVLSIHNFGPHQKLAVRHFLLGHPQRGVRYEHPAYLFEVLRESADRKAALVEVPVAHFLYADKEIIATLWKKNTRPFFQMLSDPKVPRATKIKACFSAVRKYAKLHAAGYLHGHFMLETNVVADNNGNAMIVDYTVLGRQGQRRETSDFERRQSNFAHSFFNALYCNETDAVIRKKKWQEALALEHRLDLEYRKSLKRYKKKFQPSWLRRLLNQIRSKT